MTIRSHIHHRAPKPPEDDGRIQDGDSTTGDGNFNTTTTATRPRAHASATAASVEQVAIAWVLSRGEDVVPLVGARCRDQLAEALPAVDVVLSPGQLARIEAPVPVGAVAGDRYAAAQMAGLDSKRDRATRR